MSIQVFQRRSLLAAVFVVATCGLVYELIAGAVASYLIGNSVVQYSVVIGVFLAAMGLGAWMTKYIGKQLIRTFVWIQLYVGLIGGFSATLLFVAYRIGLDMMTVVVLLTIAIGCLVGMEIPIIISVLRQDQNDVNQENDDVVPRVLAIDYAGALAASLLFPFVLLPMLGLTRAAFAFGLLNVAVGGLTAALFWQELNKPRRLIAALVVSITILFGGVWQADRMTKWFEDGLYQDEIIYADDSPYQRIIVTKWDQDFRLYLNGHLQFSLADEYRYHEPLVDPVMSLAVKHPIVAERDLRVLIMGGGDGLALKRVLEYSEVGSVDLVDLDEKVVTLFRERNDLAQLNHFSLRDKRVNLIFADAFQYLQRQDIPSYDVIILDLPDPGSTATNKLFTRSFYKMAIRHATGVGGIVAQSTSPFYARKAFWCIHDTMKDAARNDMGSGLAWQTLPYHAYVPSFGDWGFVLITPRAKSADQINLAKIGRFLNEQVLPSLFVFSEDISYVKTDVNRLEKPLLIGLHNDSWSQWNM